ncbi:MAG: L-rhamnose mutarotase [Actinobacteria bacterium]|nr:L-rhamnose mutarotase [Actinomycetota bacterium]
MKRYGSVLKLRPEKLEEYRELHDNIWPEAAEIIRQCNIRNYSIYYKDGFLFAYFEYIGENFEADMEKMAANPISQKWWDICEPMQIPLETRKEGEWWAYMDEVFHQD